MADFSMAQLVAILAHLEAQFCRASDVTFADKASLCDYIRSTFPEAFPTTTR
jgi:hypothetical protein